MFYHVKVQFTSVNESGATIKEKHEVLVDNCEFFAEAEQKAEAELQKDQASMSAEEFQKAQQQQQHCRPRVYPAFRHDDSWTKLQTHALP